MIIETDGTNEKTLTLHSALENLLIWHEKSLLLEFSLKTLISL
jgi:hypothetical protein